MERNIVFPHFAICLNNQNCEDLITGKVYQVLPDELAEKNYHLRVIDESGEDYLYPASYFFMIELPQSVAQALMPSLSVSAA